MVNKSTNTEKKADNIIPKPPSLRLKERNVKHTKIANIRELDDIFIYGERLGKGVFGTVIEITEKQTKKTWALKIVDRKQSFSGSRINTIENELKILRMVNHPHIIHLERSFESSKNYYLVIERCKTDLSIILREREIFSNEDARKVLDHLTSAVAYLHKHDIVHRDLKMENLLTAQNPYDDKDDLYIKVSDFGLGIVKTGNRLEEMLTERCGTVVYMAPEIISRSSYNHQCDIWSIGVICFLLLTGTYPFYHTTEADLNLLICNYDPITHTKFSISPEAKHLLGKLLEKNPALRISAAEANQHAWIQRTELADNAVNVLDMMQLWRDEMIVTSETGSQASDWAQAFSSLEAKSQNSLNRINTIGQQNYSAVDTAITQGSHKMFPLIYTKFGNYLGSASQKNIKKSIQSPENPLQTSPKNEKTIRALSVAGHSTKFIQIGKK